MGALGNERRPSGDSGGAITVSSPVLGAGVGGVEEASYQRTNLEEAWNMNGLPGRCWLHRAMWPPPRTWPETERETNSDPALPSALQIPTNAATG